MGGIPTPIAWLTFWGMHFFRKCNMSAWALVLHFPSLQGLVSGVASSLSTQACHKSTFLPGKGYMLWRKGRGSVSEGEMCESVCVNVNVNVSVSVREKECVRMRKREAGRMNRRGLFFMWESEWERLAFLREKERELLLNLCEHIYSPIWHHHFDIVRSPRRSSFSVLSIYMPCNGSRTRDDPELLESIWHRDFMLLGYKTTSIYCKTPYQYYWPNFNWL